MKQYFVLALIALFPAFSNLFAQHTKDTATVNNHLFIDVHYLPSGKVTYKEVAAAHAKDLAVEGKYGVQFLKYWVDEARGTVYCLSAASDMAAIKNTHQEAHGLMPQEIYEVKDGMAAMPKNGKTFFLDIHSLGANNVTAADVEAAHKKDLAVQDKYEVNFINYWVNEQKGLVLCLSQASDSSKVIQTHKEAHGLLPVSIMPVKQGQ